MPYIKHWRSPKTWSGNCFGQRGNRNDGQNIQAVVVFNRKNETVIKDLVANDFFPSDGDKTLLDPKKSHTKTGNYSYLLDIPIRNLTKEKIKELSERVQKIREKINALKVKPSSDLWKEDLESLENTDFFT